MISGGHVQARFFAFIFILFFNFLDVFPHLMRVASMTKTQKFCCDGRARVS
jgi:hypothetical protein